MRSDLVEAVLENGRVVGGWPIPRHDLRFPEGLTTFLDGELSAGSWEVTKHGLCLFLVDGVFEEEIDYKIGDLLIPSPWAKVQQDRKTWPTKVVAGKWRLINDCD